MANKIVVLGGSSPFTVALIESIAKEFSPLVSCKLVLQGRSTEALALIAEFGNSRLAPFGWHVSYSTSVCEALVDANVILHQIRYGGLEERAADELTATECGLFPDETLGPAGLRAALRTALPLNDLAHLISSVAPSAWILNLTNPLSVATAILAKASPSKCLGLCELPLATIQRACEILQVEHYEVEWSYAGLNHRGFIDRMRRDGRDFLTELPTALGTQTIYGIDSATIRELGAIPLKYFQLILGKTVIKTGRAQQLSELRARLLAELQAQPLCLPPSLSERNLDWYPLAVVPVLKSILLGDRRTHVANAFNGTLVNELALTISPNGWKPIERGPVLPNVAKWINRFSDHELAVLRAVCAPTRAHVIEAIERDPAIPSHLISNVSEKLRPFMVN